MKFASNNFVKNDMDTKTLEFIYKTILDKTQRFKSYLDKNDSTELFDKLESLKLKDNIEDLGGESWMLEFFENNNLENTLFIPKISEIQPKINNLQEPLGEKIQNGVYVNQKGLNKEEQLEIFNYLKPYLEEQASVENSATGPKMIGLELNWAWVSKRKGREGYDSDRVNIGKAIADEEHKYGYWRLSANGKELGKITDRLKQLIEKATGVNVKDYDSAIVNLYDSNMFIGSHADINDSITAINYPVVAVNIGGSGNFAIGGMTQGIPLKDGAGYSFGFEGNNRNAYHRTFPSKSDGFLPKIITKQDGKTYEKGSYRITITMRRAMPLTSGMPNQPILSQNNLQEQSNTAVNPIAIEKVKPQQLDLFSEVENLAETKLNFDIGVVDEIFNKYPELNVIGTKEEYIKYLDNVFPDSNVKEILFHGSDSEFDTFDKKFRGVNTSSASFTDGTEIDSKNAFFFSNNENSTFQYSYIKQLEKISNLSSAIGNLSINFSLENAKVIRKIDANLADYLNEKRKELNNDELFKKYLKTLYLKYNKADKELGVGFLNQINNYVNSKKSILKLEKDKKNILENSKYKREYIYIYDEDYGVTKINEKGLIRSSKPEYNNKNVFDLTSKEFDNLINSAKKINNQFFDKLEKNIKSYKLTPKTYNVIINVKNSLTKDFENISFVSQLGKEKSAQYDASKLTQQAVKEGRDSVIFENIKDPYLATNYGVFESNQIHILGNKKDLEDFKNFNKNKEKSSVNSNFNEVKEQWLKSGRTEQDWNNMSKEEKEYVIKNCL